MKQSIQSFIVLILTLMLFACTGAGDPNDLTPGTIGSNPNPTLPGLRSAFFLTEQDLPGLSSGLGSNLAMATAASHDFTLILLQTDELIESQCLIGSGERIFTLDVVNTEFGFVHLIDPEVDPFMISLICGVQNFFFSVFPGFFLPDVREPVPLGIGDNFTTVPDSIQQEIHDGADFFLLVTNTDNMLQPYRMVRPTLNRLEYSFYIPGLRQEFLNGDNIILRLFLRDATDTLEFIPTTAVISEPVVPTALPNTSYIYSIPGGPENHTFFMNYFPSNFTQNPFNCQYSVPGVHAWTFRNTWVTDGYLYKMPREHDPFLSQFYCSSTLTYAPQFEAGTVVNVNSNPVKMIVRGSYMTPEASFQDEMRSRNVVLMASRLKGENLFNLPWLHYQTIYYASPDQFHYPNLDPYGPDIPWAFIDYGVYLDAVAASKGDEVRFHLLIHREAGRLEIVPMEITKIIACEWRYENGRSIEICQD